MEALATYLLATRPDAVALCQGTDQAVMHFLKTNQLPQRPTSSDVVLMAMQSMQSHPVLGNLVQFTDKLDAQVISDDRKSEFLREWVM